MNKNINQLLDILLQQNSYLTASQLAEMLGVTERSIRNYVRTLNRSEMQTPLILSSAHGYKIQRNIYSKGFKKQFLNGDESNLLFRIALLLINQQNYITYDMLANQLHYSVESIRSKVQLLFSKIKERHIKVQFDSQIFIGIRIIGNETQKRLLLEQLVLIESITKQHLTQTIYAALNGIVDQNTIGQQINLLDKVFSRHHATMDFIVYAKIICHMIILMIRHQQGNVIAIDKVDQKIVNYSEYQLAVTVLTSQNPKISEPSEIALLTNYLISLPMNIPGIFVPEIDIKQRKVIENSLQSAELYYSIPLYSDKQYRKQITAHILRLLKPIEESIPIFNPYSKKTKREYLFAYSIACFLYDGLQNAFNLRIPESEIAYLALHIQLILAEEAKDTIKTLLVFKGKQSEAELFRYKLQNFFPTIKVTDVVTSINLKETKTYQLIILIDFDTPKKALQNVMNVSRELNAQDISKVQLFVESFGTFSLISDLDYYHMNESSSTDAIEYLIKKSGYDSLLSYFIKRESMSPTDIGNMVALPHPFLKGSETSAKIIIGINNKDIKWGHQKVRLVIIYIPAADLKINKDFFNDVYQCTSNLRLIQKLLQTKTKQEFVQIWNQKRRLS
ncbi:BglG family transcription antiterminator [Liquorilactobacillus mali]|uniref:Phosphoenolpyruvate-dependent sugar phosphotransferase system, EIIA 2 PRD n=1 Tax=Liquorilactobacillus mali KCTC 3596 = DSM 20444 TaxID=1046596 RepID=J1F170_9LACO|nr:HTH domain-containing protein [Liquorilactobacillus mali]EJE97993.1 Putative PRD domain protein [Liquorilactobacillus mali KCTC 3596 = DSM 20444]KRN08660.1 phosphoenolpyruvate-dependent sugar phosphotransferase system, EIIA 2 PRD [Liquorilactobacillus mali KCTC 3596 = DSM 20444]MDC7952428.1 HTH domain-containing protein [Liquorilactobacillus mali]QFQ75746.1 HTH domain-containing protein [Liquorilactobacillus mali]